MKSSPKPPQDVSSYIAGVPVAVQKHLQKIRKLVLKADKRLVESMAYGMPAYKLHKKPVFYFGAFTKHIGVYATPNCHAKFAKQLKPYKQGKGSVQFALTEPIPFDLIEQMIKFNVQNIKK